MNDLFDSQPELFTTHLPMQTPLDDLRHEALNHYDEVASKAHHYRSDIPRAINFYYDYKEMNFWSKIKLCFSKRFKL